MKNLTIANIAAAVGGTLYFPQFDGSGKKRGAAKGKTKASTINAKKTCASETAIKTEASGVFPPLRRGQRIRCHQR